VETSEKGWIPAFAGMTSYCHSMLDPESTLVRLRKTVSFFRGAAAIMAFLITLILIAPAHAGYMDKCLQEILPLENGSYIGAMQCGYLDFFMYIDEKGNIIRRNYVPQYWRDTLKGHSDGP